MAEPAPATALVDWLDDLSVRFLLNLPKSELSSVPRLCFQVEEAQWFYEDFVRPAVAASGAQPLPSLPLRQFCLMLFQHCPLLSGYNDAQHIAAYEEFLAYKVRVPVRGAILLDESMEKVVLVRGWKKGSSWSFPRGKINKDEKDLDCAIREVYEETGYDVRQAGLVPEDEKEAKYIDITMREQHMRLFVFRGVPEDTHFEPKTRKEISKIQWYSIRDLPGFKKQKPGQVNDAGNANKFYMVAPFLGQLKKWINLQRKKDVSQPRHMRVTSDGLGIQTTTEDEGETEEFTPDPAPDQKSEELKRLLSIGSGNAMPAQPANEQNSNQKNDLLAMLRGGSLPANGNAPPQTPFEQVNTFPKEPETPHPQHMRQPSLPPQQQPPQYPLSPPRMPSEQLRNYSLPTPQIFGPGPQFGGYPPNQQQGFPGVLPPHMQQQQQFQQRQSVPNMPFGQPNHLPFHVPPNQHMQPPPVQQQHPSIPPPFEQHMPNAYMAQGPQGAIASGPAVPNPSQLPAPRLNAHHMNLLNAFKSGNQSSAPSAPAAQPTSRHGSTHQAALLDLFRKPSTPQAPSTEPTPAPPPAEQQVSPTLTDVTEKPRRPKQERKPTLNEITRTLPLKTKAKSPPPQSATVPSTSRPASGQLFDPNTGKLAAASSTRPQQQQQPSISVLQRPASRDGSQPAPAKPSVSPAQNAPAKQKANGAPPAPFTILARPGSRGLKSPGPVAPPSPLRNQTPQSPSPFQPQVLKRPKSGEEESIHPAPDAVQQKKPQASIGDGQKDHLLALFAKSSGVPAASNPFDTVEPPRRVFDSSPLPLPTQAQEAHEKTTTKETQADSQRNALLDLFKSPVSSSQQATPTPAPAAPQSQPQPSLELPSEPPSAPRLAPSRTPSSSSHAHSHSQSQKIHPIRQPRQQDLKHNFADRQPMQQPKGHHLQTLSHTHSRSNQQNLLLDIFNRPSSSTSNQHTRTQTPPMQSPGTPISPFTLGTPANANANARGQGFSFELRQGERVVGRNSETVERKGSVEDKDRKFLMGYLAGVAKGGRE